MAAHFLCLLLCYINCNWVARIAISPRSESNRLQDRGAEPGEPARGTGRPRGLAPEIGDTERSV